MKKSSNRSFSTRPVALITGGASPLGAAICRRLASDGMSLILHYGKSREQTLKLQKELDAKSIKTSILQADLQKIDHAPKLIQKIIRQWGRLDVVVNNA